MIKEAIVKLSKKEDLTYQEAETVMDEIMSGQATPVQMSSYLTALSIKGETIDEITASAAGMRAHCIKLLHDLDVLEIVGTGGDGANSFNISTFGDSTVSFAPPTKWQPGLTIGNFLIIPVLCKISSKSSPCLQLIFVSLSYKLIFL